MEKYADVPMSFADACLVRMTEVSSDPTLLTTDTDFRIYRRHGRKARSLRHAGLNQIPRHQNAAQRQQPDKQKHTKCFRADARPHPLPRIHADQRRRDRKQ